MITSLQCRMARAALNLSLRNLSRQSRLPLGAISKFEKDGPLSPERRGRLAETFAEAGLLLVGDDGERGAGVRLTKDFRRGLVFDLEGRYVADIIGNALVDAADGRRLGSASDDLIAALSEARAFEPVLLAG